MDITKSNEWKSFRDYYNDNKLIDQIGLFRYEDLHTNYLVSILNDINTNTYGYKDIPFKLFLKLIKNTNNLNNIKYLNNIDLNKEYEIKNLNINIRKRLLNKIPDMSITFSLIQNNIEYKYLIILEAKLDSIEHDKQCDKYYNAVKELNNIDEKIFIYLTLNRSKCSNNNYNLISYQDLVDYIYLELLKYKSNKVLIPISDYLKTFNFLYNFKYTDINSYIITNKELTINLWNKLLEINNIWDKDGLWKDLYNNNSYIFKIFIINSILLKKELNNYNNIIEEYYKKLTYKYKYKNNYIDTSEGIYYLLKELIIYKNINNKEDIDKRLLVTTYNWNNLEDYKKNDNYIYNIDIGNKKYYCYECNELDLDNFINMLKITYYDFYKDIIKVPYIKD